MKKNGFTLIELLVVLVIMGILSSLGVVGYNSYVDSSNDVATKNNYNKITKVLEAEFAKCKLNKNSKILDNHSCASPPTISLLDNYFTNTQKLKNSYNQNNKVIQNDICTPGGVTIKTTNTGIYETAYFSQKNNTKNTSNINSTWAQKFTDNTSTSVSISCAQTASAPISIATYKVPENLPHNGFGAYIVVDKDGKMSSNWATYSGCEYNYCGNKARETGTGGYDVIWDRAGNKKPQPGEYVFVLIQANRGTQPPGTVLNSSVPFNSDGQRICTNRDCSYNFTNNTFTDDRTGQVFEAGSGKRVK
jgi:prepilin-type N-terminal cleavage/methylation domain-containing protein